MASNGFQRPMTDRLPTKVDQHTASHDAVQPPSPAQLSEQAQIAMSLAAQPQASRQSAAADNGVFGLLKTGTQAALHSAIDEPLTGLTQLVNHVAGTRLDAPDLFGAPQQAAFGSKAWYAETIGSGVGMVVPFLLTQKATDGILGRTRLATTFGIGSEEAARAVKFLPAVTKSTLDGALYGLVLTPNSDPNRGFWQQRLTNAASGGLTFGTQAAVSRGLMGGLGKLGVPLNDQAFMHTMGGMGVRIGSNAFGGAVAGSVSAESNSLLSGHGFATQDQLKQSVASFLVTGGALDAFHIIGERSGLKSSQKGGKQLPADAGNKSNLSGITRSLMLPLTSGLAEVGRSPLAEAPPEAKAGGDKISGAEVQPATKSPAVERQQLLADAPQLKATVDHLESNADKVLAESGLPEAAQQAADFRQLVDEALQRRQSVQDAGQIDRALLSVDQILTSKLVVDLTPAQRLGLSKQLLYEVANPKSIDQGPDHTCGPAVAQEMALHTNPDKQLEAVTSLLTTGKFRTQGANPVTVDLSAAALSHLPEPYRHVLQPDAQAKRSLEAAATAGGIPLLDGERSYASQLAQLLAGNIRSQAMAAEGQKAIYVKGQPDRSNPLDTGERLFNMQTYEPVLGTDGKPKIGPGVQSRDLQGIWERITGQNSRDNNWVLINTHQGLASGEGQAVLSPKQLRQALLSANRPFAVEVNPDHPLLRGDAQQAAGKEQSTHRHVVLVEQTKNPRTGRPYGGAGEPRFSLYDQYGRKYDMTGRDGVTAEQLFEAMRQPHESPAIHASQTLEGIGNFGVVDERGFFRGRKPDSIEGIRSLKEKGVTLIIDLIENPSAEPGKTGRSQEQAWVDEVGGMRYLHIPTSVKDFGSEQVQQIFSAIEAELNPTDGRPPGKVFLHCMRGADRTGTISALWRLTHQPGWTPALAKVEMEEFGHTGNTRSTERMAQFLPKFSMFGKAPESNTAPAPEYHEVGYAGRSADHVTDQLIELQSQPQVLSHQGLRDATNNLFEALANGSSRDVPQGIVNVLDRVTQLFAAHGLNNDQATSIINGLSDGLKQPDAPVNKTLFSSLSDASQVRQLSGHDLLELTDFARIVSADTGELQGLKQVIDDRIAERLYAKRWESTDQRITEQQIAELKKAGISDPEEFARQMKQAQNIVPGFSTKNLLNVLHTEQHVNEILDGFGADNYIEVIKRAISQGNKYGGWSSFFSYLGRSGGYAKADRSFLQDVGLSIGSQTPEGRVLAARYESDPVLNRQATQRLDQITAGTAGNRDLRPLLAMHADHFDGLVRAALAYDVPTESPTYDNLLSALQRRATKDLQGRTAEERQQTVHGWAELIAKEPYSIRSKDVAFSVLKAMQSEDFANVSDADFKTITRSITKNRIEKLSLSEKRNLLVGLLSDARTPIEQRDTLVSSLADTPKLMQTLTDSEVRLVDQQAEQFIERYEQKSYQEAQHAVPNVVDQFTRANGKSVDIEALTSSVPEPYRNFVASSLQRHLDLLDKGPLSPQEIKDLSAAVRADLEREKAQMTLNPLRPAASNIRGFVNNLLSAPMSKTELSKFADTFPAAVRGRVLEIFQERGNYLSMLGLSKEFGQIAHQLRTDRSNFVEGAKDSRGYPVEKIRVLTVGEASPGAALGYLFRKQTRVEIEPNTIIRDRNGRSILRTGDGQLYSLTDRGAFKLDKFGAETGKPVQLGKMILFDPAGRLPPQARSSLTIEKPQGLQTFYDGPNYLDLMAAGVGRQAQLRRAVAAAVKAQPNQREAQFQTDALNAAYDAVRGANGQDRVRLETSAKLYAISLADKIPPRVTAYLLRTGPEYAGPSTLMHQAAALHRQIAQFAGSSDSRSGAIPENVRFVTNADNGGSTHLIMHLYRVANGLTDPAFDRYFVPADNMHVPDLQGKKLIYLDDYAYSGKQAFEAVSGIQKWLHERGMSNQVTAATLGAYEEGKQYFESRRLQLPTEEAAQLHLTSGQAYKDIRQELRDRIEQRTIRKQFNLQRREENPGAYLRSTADALQRMRDIIRDYRAVARSADRLFSEAELEKKERISGHKKGDYNPDAQAPKVVSHLITPWMVSNDNPVFINDAVAKYLNIRALAHSSRRMLGLQERTAFDTTASDRQFLETELQRARQSNHNDAYLSDTRQAEFISEMERMAKLRLGSTDLPPTTKERAQLFEDTIRQLPFLQNDPIAGSIRIMPDATLDDSNKASFTQLVAVDDTGKTHTVHAEMRSPDGFIHVVPSKGKYDVRPYSTMRAEIHVPEQKLVDLSDPARADAAFADLCASIYHQLHSLDQMSPRAAVFDAAMEEPWTNRKVASKIALDKALQGETKDRETAALAAARLQTDMQALRDARTADQYAALAQDLSARLAAEHIIELGLWTDLPFEKPKTLPARLNFLRPLQFELQGQLLDVSALDVSDNQVWMLDRDGRRYPLKMTAAIRSEIQTTIETDPDVLFGDRQQTTAELQQINQSPVDQAAMIARYLLELSDVLSGGNGG